MSLNKIPKTAMVLAAGRGKRMRPISATTPKPLVEIRGRALIDHVLDRLVAVGVQRAVVNVHYLAEWVECHVRKRKDVEILISDEREELLDTGGAVVKALPLLGDEPFFHMNTDSIWIEGPGRNLEGLASHYDSRSMDGLLMLANTVGSVGYDGKGDFFMSDDGALLRRPEQKIAPFAFAGVGILDPKLFAGRKLEAFSANRPWDDAMAEGRLHGYVMDGIWLHVGTPDAIGRAERRIATSNI